MDQEKLFRMPDRSGNREALPAVKEKRKIAVAGAGRGSGVSLLTGLLAAWAAAHKPREAVTLAELGSPYFYEAFGIGKRFLQRDFYPFYTLMAQQRSIKGLSNCEEGIRWALRCPGEYADPTAPGPSVLERLRLIHNLEGTLLLFDCSGLSLEALWEILPEMDAVVFVADPLPSTLIPAAGLVDRIRMERPDAVWVLNKMNRGVHRGELQRFLGRVSCLEIPCLAPEDLCRAQYNCQLPYSIASVRQKTGSGLKELWDRLERAEADLFPGQFR